MTKSFRESLDEILATMTISVHNADSTKEENNACSEAKAALIEVVRGLVPDENVFDYDSKKKLHHRWEGWNACRQALLKKMEE